MSSFWLDGLRVHFPYTYIYPEQYRYMLRLKRSLDAKGPCVLEMPSGTGKTVSLLSLILSYQLAHPETGKLIYCSRTVSEIEKCIEELKRVIAYRDSQLEGAPKTLALALTSRKNLCLHPKVSQLRYGHQVDSACRDLTASWVREKYKAAQNATENEGQDNVVQMDVDEPEADGQEGRNDSNGESAPLVDIEDLGTCSYFEEFDENGKDTLMQGIYSLEDMREFGKEKGWCPYFLARHMLAEANVIVYSYHYLIDPKIARMVSDEFTDNSIIVFDEAHNIDNVCIEALSVSLSRSTMDGCTRNIVHLSNTIKALKRNDEEKLMTEYRRLLNSLAQDGVINVTDTVLADPTLSDDLVYDLIPGNIRKAEHFLSLLRRLCDFVRSRLAERRLSSEGPHQFLFHLQQKAQIDPGTLKFCSTRLQSLLRTLEVRDINSFTPLSLLATFATLLGTYATGPVRRFTVLVDEVLQMRSTSKEMEMQLCCLDASLAIAPVFKKFKNVIITSGTLSPLEMFPKLLAFEPVISERFTMSLHRPCVCPLIVTRGSDQVPVSSKFDLRSDKAVVRNYGNMLIELAAIVPDGIVCFFTSYHYMEGVLDMWHQMNILNELLKHKLLFIETPDTLETSMAMENYRKACDSGRGAIFFSVGRGKVSEGVDFDHHYGRCVIMFGIPYVYTESRVLRARLEFLRDQYQIREADYLTFDAMRSAAQCVGRVIRGKTDYGIMIFADKRFNRMDKRSKLPQWISQFIGENHCNLSTDMALAIVKKFLRDMAQPTSIEDEIGTSLWTLEHIQMQATSTPPAAMDISQ